jgi:hypothetical protein
MQTFFEIMFMSVIAIGIMSNLFVLAKISFLISRSDYFERELSYHHEISKEVLRLLRENDRSLQTLKEAAVKPIKPNNWDAINKAFTRPSARIEVNERD